MADLNVSRAAIDLLAHRPLPATVLDDLETGATAGGLLSEKMAEPRNESFVPQHKIVYSAYKFKRDV